MLSPIRKLQDLAQSVVARELDPIEGARSMVGLDLPGWVRESDAFLAIRSIESEADQFSTAESRQHFAPEYREQIEARLADFTKDAEVDMLMACQDIIAAKGSKLFINSLMSQLWAFRAAAVADRMHFAPALAETSTFDEAQLAIEIQRNSLPRRPRQPIPL